MPSAALFLMPIILSLSYLLYRRFGAYFPFSCLCAYGMAALILNYDVLTVVYFCALVAAFVGLVLSAQLSPYLLCVAVAAVTAVVGALAGVGIVRLAENKPIADVAARYVSAEYDDPIIGYLARRGYDGAKLLGDKPKLEPTDDGYADAVIAYYSGWAHDEFEQYAAYYCVHYGAVFAAVGYFFAVMLNRRTASRYDVSVSGDELSLSTLALGGARVECTTIADMKMPRAYLWTCLLPALVASIALDIAGDYAALSATVMHSFVTLPTAYCFFTLAAFFASLFKGRAQIAAYALLAMISVAIVAFPIVLFIVSLIGISDVILNLRFWTKFIMSDSDIL